MSRNAQQLYSASENNLFKQLILVNAESIGDIRLDLPAGYAHAVTDKFGPDDLLYYVFRRHDGFLLQRFCSDDKRPAGSLGLIVVSKM